MNAVYTSTDTSRANAALSTSASLQRTNLLCLSILYNTGPGKALKKSEPVKVVRILLEGVEVAF